MALMNASVALGIWADTSDTAVPVGSTLSPIRQRERTEITSDERSISTWATRLFPTTGPMEPTAHDDSSAWQSGRIKSSSSQTMIGHRTRHRKKRHFRKLPLSQRPSPKGNRPCTCPFSLHWRGQARRPGDGEFSSTSCLPRVRRYVPPKVPQRPSRPELK